MQYTRRDDRPGRITSVEEENRDEQKEQMIYSTEALSTGTEIHIRIVLRHCTSLERGAWWSAIERFLENPKIGGGGATGHGRIDWPASLRTPDRQILDDYDAFIAREKDGIIEAINDLGDD